MHQTVMTAPQPPHPAITTIGANQRLRRLSHPVLSESFARIMNSLVGDDENLIYSPLGNLQFVPLRKRALWKSLELGRMCGLGLSHLEAGDGGVTVIVLLEKSVGIAGCFQILLL